MNDRYSYVTPAKVKCLLVPINSCTQSNFDRYVDIIRRSVSEARLLDITPNTALHFFNPQTFPNGRIIFDFVTTSPDSESIFLHDFEPFRKTFIVLGVGMYTDQVHTQKAITQLKKVYPSSIVHDTILFDTPAETLQAKPENEGTFLHDGSLDHNITAMETIMCDVSAHFLSALDNYASSYTNITLRSPVSITDSHTLTKTIHQAQKRLSSGSTSFKASFSNSNSGQPTSIDPKSKSQQRHSGRQAKLMGNFYLLAGKYVQALQSFTDCLVNLKKTEDFLWLGSALEGIGISVLLLQYVNVSYQLASQTICGVLQISKSKLNSMAAGTSSSNSEVTTPKRTSAETSTSHNNGRTSLHVSKPSHTRNNSNLSPRNSTSSNLSFNFTTGPELSTLPIPLFIKLLSSKTLHFYNLSTNDYENMVPDIVYVESILRTIKYMLGIYLSGNELNSNVIDHIIKATRITSHIADKSHFSKADILVEIEKVFSLQLVDMGITDQCRIYCSLASVYSDLKLYRKRAFILRTLMVGILPKLEQHVSQSQSGDCDDVSLNIDSWIERRNETSSIRDIFDYLFATYNIDCESESNSQAAYTHSQGNWTALQISLIRLCLRVSEILKDWSFILKLCTLLLTRFTHCLTAEDQQKLKEKIDDLIYLSNRNKLNLSTKYWDPFLVRKVKFITNRHKDELVSFLEYESKNKSSVGNQASSSKDPVIFNPYNKQKPASINKDKLLIKDEIYQLKVQLQNPFAFEVEITNISIVTEGDVRVQTLVNNIKSVEQVGPAQNLNNSQTKVQSLNTKLRNASGSLKKVSVAQSPLISSSQVTSNTLIIPPNSLEQFLVTFKPLNDGDLIINGFYVSINNCEEQYFRIIDKEVSVRDLKIKSPDHPRDESGIIDKVIDNLEANNIDSRVNLKKLYLSVIPPQPSLSLTNISVTNGWIMLLEGEQIPFSISLTNHSNELINYLSFSFWDSTVDNLNKKLNSSGNQLSASDIYEIEWHLLKFRPFKILNKEMISEKYEKILPNSDITIDYEITAKRGIRESKIILEYAHKLADLSKSFVKYVQVPLNLSIMPSLEVVGCDILPLFSSSLDGFEGIKSEFSHKNLEDVFKFITSIIESASEDISDYCLLIVDLRNSWNEKLESQLQYSIDSSQSFEANDNIEPGKTSRFLLPVKRISNDDIDLTKPIPSLRNKQFIKNYSVSEQEEMKMRELFWLRSSVLENLQGTWKSVGGSDERRGYTELRSIRLTNKMANILIHNPIKISSVIFSDRKPDVPIKKSGSQYLLNIEEFYFLRTTIINNSSTNIKGMLRHMPFPVSGLSSLNTNSPNYTQMTIDRRILINGVLQNHLGEGGIEPGQRVDLDLSFVILEKGEYEWGSILDILNANTPQITEREPVCFSAI